MYFNSQQSHHNPKVTNHQDPQYKPKSFRKIKNRTQGKKTSHQQGLRETLVDSI